MILGRDRHPPSACFDELNAAVEALLQAGSPPVYEEIVGAAAWLLSRRSRLEDAEGACRALLSTTPLRIPLI